jgi:competence protein ComEA
VSEGSLRERLSALSRAELVGLVALLAVTLGGAGLWYVRSLPKPVAVASSDKGGVPAPAASASPSPTVILLVDVAGWVRHPGVYEFDEGARVIDAIDAAGGARTGAMLTSLNLAAPLTDGSQILVPKETDGGAAPIAGASGAGAAPGALINVNTATATELEALPGVGEVIAQAIVDYRTENGPFASVDALLDVSGIGDATLENIRDLVTV